MSRCDFTVAKSTGTASGISRKQPSQTSSVHSAEIYEIDPCLCKLKLGRNNVLRLYGTLHRRNCRLKIQDQGRGPRCRLMPRDRVYRDPLWCPTRETTVHGYLSLEPVAFVQQGCSLYIIDTGYIRLDCSNDLVPDLKILLPKRGRATPMITAYYSFP